MPSFIEDFIARGYLYQCTNIEKLTHIFSSHSTPAYIGFDCTAPSLHVGNLLQVMILRLLQQHKHKPIIVIGGTTTRIGDPTDRTELRKMLTDEEITVNIAGIKKSLAKFISFGDGPTDALIVDNTKWLDTLGYVQFLRNCGKFISVNYMLSMDSIKQRLERQQPLTFLEFNYSLLQAYDFYELNKQYDCKLQIGGSDQWGNIIMGVDLCHKLAGSEVYGLTTPLLTTASGAKMGKSITGAVWLNEDMLSAYEYYQYWRNCNDSDVMRFATLYAEFNEEEYANFLEVIRIDINTAKKQLAAKLTAMCHGYEAAEQAEGAAVQVFELGSYNMNLPTEFITPSSLIVGIPICDLLQQVGLTASKSEARRLIRGNGVKINDNKILNENMLINSSNLIENNYFTLSIGKKKHILIKLSSPL